MIASSAFALVAVITLTLAVPSGSANAAFKVMFDDPKGGGVDITIVDGGPGDLADGDVGVIRFAIDEEGLETVGTALSKSALGNTAVPALLLNVNAFQYNLGSLNIRVTDTDFTLGASTGYATAVQVVVDGDGFATFDYSGDTGTGSV